MSRADDLPDIQAVPPRQCLIFATLPQGLLAMVRSIESRLERLADDRTLADVDESDPRSVARWMRRMGQAMGEDPSDEFDEAVELMERGGGEEAAEQPG